MRHPFVTKASFILERERAKRRGQVASFVQIQFDQRHKEKVKRKVNFQKVKAESILCTEKGRERERKRGREG